MTNSDMSFYLDKTSDLLLGLLEVILSLQEDPFLGEINEKIVMRM